MKIKTKQKNNTKQFTQALNQIKRTISLGFFREDGTYPGTNLNVVDLAKIHEYGVDIRVTRRMRKWFVANGYPLQGDTKTITLPERSFVRNAFDNNVNAIGQLIDAAVERINASPGNLEQIIEKLADDIAEILKADIDLGNLSSKLRHEIKNV